MGKNRFRQAVALGVLVLMGLLPGCGTEIVQTWSLSAETQPSQTKPVSQSLPYTLPDSGLIVEDVVSYSGDYWEDGSGDHVEGVTGLLLYNPAERMVEFFAVSLEQTGKKQYFFLYRLPPKSRCLVLEKSRQLYTTEDIFRYQELSIQWEYQDLSREQLDYLGFGEELMIINRTPRQKDHVTLWYKRYLAEEGYYLGGISYSAHLFFLQPLESRILNPTHYNAAHARVVNIILADT